MNRQDPELLLDAARPSRRAVLGSALTGWAALVGLSQAAQAAAPAASGILYVATNDARVGQNAILAFRRGADGSLTPLPGSPFLTRGRGQGNPDDEAGDTLDADQELVISPDKQFLFAVNSGSNTVAVFHILRDGRLIHVSGSPFPSGGINPQSVGFANGKLYVINKNEDRSQPPNMALPNITGFRVTSAGRLLPIPGSTVNLPADSAPAQALISKDGRFLFEPEIAFNVKNDFSVTLGNPVLRSFQIRANGQLVQAPGSPLTIPPFPVPEGSQVPLFPPDTRIALGLTNHPTLPVFYSGITSSGSVGAYSYNETTGQVTFEGSGTVGGVAPCWLVANSAGTRLYVSSTLSTTVSVVDITSPLSPVEIQTLPLPGTPNSINLALDPAGKFLYVLSQRSNGFPFPGAVNGINIFAVAADGTLSPAANPVVSLASLGTSATIKGIAIL
jgi:6-phosphogluconolactonase (cycloisomerase 2 family)